MQREFFATPDRLVQPTSIGRDLLSYDTGILQLTARKRSPQGTAASMPDFREIAEFLLDAIAAGG